MGGAKIGNKNGVKGPNKIIYQDDMLTKFLIESIKHGDIEVLIDTEDWNKIKQYHWYVGFDKKGNNFYILTEIKGKNIRLHRFIFDLINSKRKVDHRNHITTDNRKANLRKCNDFESAQNRKSRDNCMSQYKGLTYRKKEGKWQARIAYNHKRISLGYFKDEIEAAKAYNTAAIKYHKEFAYLNPIPEEN